MDDFSVKIESKSDHKRAKKAFKALGAKRLQNLRWSICPLFPFWWTLHKKTVRWTTGCPSSLVIALEGLEEMAKDLTVPLKKEQAIEEAAKKYAGVLNGCGLRYEGFFAGAEWERNCNIKNPGNE